MLTYENLIQNNIQSAIDFIKDSPWRDQYLEVIRSLGTEFQKPCVLTVAVAGRVKAGKSTLINALLGADLAKVGILPTTATINSFHYFPGQLDHPDKPIQCILRPQDETNDDKGDSCDRESENSRWISVEELNRLQTNDPKALKETLNIREMRFYLDNDSLKEMNLVDTPGTQALISEHTDQTDEFFKIYDTEEKRRLANERIGQNNKDTNAYTSRADAVLFVSGNVPLESMKEFLEKFQGSASSRNAIGLISQIDVNNETLKNRETLASEMGRHLKNVINTAIPISACLARTLQKLEPTGQLREIQKQIKQFEPDDLDFCLKYADEWESMDAPEYPIAAKDRKALSQGIPFETFALIARELARSNYDEAVKNLWEISGFVRLRKLLQDHFLSRKRILRCYKTILSLMRIFEEIRRARLIEYRDDYDASRKELADMKQYIMKCPKSDSAIRCRIFDVLEKAFPGNDSDDWEEKLANLWVEFENTLESLKIFNIRFDGLLLLSQNPKTFTESEVAELNQLFGCYGGEQNESAMTDAQKTARKSYWMMKRQVALKGSAVKNIADLAFQCYSFDLKQNK